MKIRPTHRLGSISALIVVSMLAITLSAPAAAQELHSFNISASDPASALHALSEQAGIQILASAADLRGKKFNAVSGTLTTPNALSALLAGTGLNYRYVGEAAVALVPSGAAHRVPISATSDATSEVAAAAAPTAQPAAAAAPAAPAAAGGSELQEIVVTAERRQEDITKVPISITAITQQNIDTLGIKDFTDMAKYTPGVVIDTDRTNEISIRGISSSGGADTTGIYIDDTPIQTRTDIDALPEAFDVDRIEVLRGPQGTLFGAGAEGGAVRYITTQPSVTQSSIYSRDEISYTQGGAENYSIGVAGGMPLIDNVLGFRVSALVTYLGGWQDRIDPYSTTLMNLPPSEELASHNVVDSNANRSYRKMFRLAVLWEPTQNWQITPSVYYQIKSQNDISQYYPIYSNPSQDQYYDGDPERYPYVDHFYLSSVKIQGNLGFADLISNSSYFDRYTSSSYGGTEYNLGFFQDLAQDDDEECNPGYPCTTPNKWGQGLPWVNGTGYHLPDGFRYYAPAPTLSWFYNETQEVRLQSNTPSSPIQWTVGLFYELDQQIDQNWIYGYDDAALWAISGYTIPYIFGIPNLTDPNASWYTWENQYTRQYAIYGDASYAFTDQWKLDIGLRESKITYSFDELTAGSQEFGPPLPAGGVNKANSFTPKANLNFQATPNNLYYATYARGFRPGGANSPISYASCATDFKNLGLTSTPLSYSSDTTESYEIGAKNNVANQLQLATSVYYIDWYHIQQFALLPICGIGFIGNLGQAVAKGVDFQGDWRATEHLTFNLAAGYTQARYTAVAKISPQAPTPIVEPGDAINGANGMPNPPWSGTLGLEYRFTAFAHEAFFRADDQYISGPKWLGPQFDPRTTLYDSYNYPLASLNQINLRTGVTVGLWEIDAFVNNLSDAHPITTYSFTVPADVDRDNRLEWVNTIVPRTMGVTVLFHK
jgi:iron complex outermembrane recepter protein